MSKVKRLLKYELRRIWANKIWLFTLLAVLTIAVTAIAVSYVKRSADEISHPDKSIVMQEYEHDLAYNRDILENYSDQLTDLEKFNVGRQIELLEFYLDTDTTGYDYLNIATYMNQKIKGYEVICGCIYFGEYSTFLFIALAVALALWAFSAEIQTGAIKNLLASPTDRKSAFAVKTATSAFAVLVLPVLAYIVSLIICAGAPQGTFLMYSGGYKAVAGIHIFAQLGLRNILVIACFYAVTFLCSLYLKPLASALLTVLGYFAVAFIAISATSKLRFVFLGVTAFDAFNLFPVVGLHNYIGGFDIHFIIMVVAHFAAICLLVFFAGRKFVKRDF